MGRWILEDENARRHLDTGLDEFEDSAPTGDEGGVVGQPSLDIVEATEGVEVVSVVVVQRSVVAQTTERRIGVCVDGDVVRVVVRVGRAVHIDVRQ
jgi:hypothetical protein